MRSRSLSEFLAPLGRPWSNNHRLGLRGRLLVPAIGGVVVSVLAGQLIAGATWNGLVGGLAVAGAIGSLLWWVVVLAVIPVENLATRLRQLAAEGSGIGGRIDEGGYDDVAAIAKDFNTLMGRLQSLVAPLSTRTEPLVAAANDLASFSSRIPGQIAAMDANSDKVLEVTRKASNDLAGVSGSLQDVSACIGMLSTSADEIARSLVVVEETCRSEVELAGKAREEAGNATETTTFLSESRAPLRVIESDSKLVGEQADVLSRLGVELGAMVEGFRKG